MGRACEPLPIPADFTLNEMSIEITGPRAYKFQDRVCVLLAILASKDVSAEMRIEPEDGEDAQLTLVTHGKRCVVELQIKSERGAIGPAKLVDWLMHFPSHKAKNSLLESLVADVSRSVLFVSSGRCSDATVAHVVQLSADRTSLEEGAVKQSAEAVIRHELLAYAAVASESDGDLTKRRRAHIGQEVPQITGASLRSALHRVMLAEQQNDADVTKKVREALLSTCRVVPDHIDRVVQEIEDIVVREKRTGTNVLPKIAAVIASGRAADPLLSATHVERDEESVLREQIVESNVVLISGAPRVGKSFVARSLAASLQKLDFRVRISGSVEEAARYLLEPVDELRVALVDDPLGGAHASGNAVRELHQLEQLIPRLSIGRRLIVAQAQDRLLEVTRLASAQGLQTAGHAWTTLGPGAPAFLDRIWLEAAMAHRVPTLLKDQVSKELLTGRLDLEPGCLVHLASRHQQVTAGAQLNEVVRVARQDAKALGNALRAEKLAPLLTALAVASTPELKVGETDLAFILDAARTDRPGESDVTGTMVSVGARVKSKGHATTAVETSYVPVPKLGQPEQEGLEQLELRRMVSESQQTYTFSHPFYRASAESLLDAATRRTREAAIQQLERAIFTLSPDSAKAAATNLDWIHRNLSTPEDGGGVVSVARMGLNSIFLTVRELCFAFLVKQLPSLPQEEQGEVSDWLNKVTWPRLSYVVWSNDEPRIPPSTIAGALEVDPFPERVKKSEVAETLALLDSNRPDKISTQAAGRAVQFLADSPQAMTVQIAARLLSFDVSLVRAPAAKAWLRIPRRDDSSVLERIFVEEHPSVAQAAYRGVVRAWWECDEGRRNQFVDGLRKMAASPVTAAALVGDLVLIARREYGGSPTPWRIFEALMPIVLRELPLGATLRDERLFDVVESAIGNISQDALTAIVDHWVGLVAKIADSGGIPSDYMLGVSDIVVSGLPIDTPNRMEWMGRLLALPGTASRIRVVADFVVRWDDLADLEREKLLDHLVADAPDYVWIQAAALTRAVVPAEVQKAILQAGPRLNATADEVIADVEPELLNACVNVFTGNHPAIYYVGAQGSRSKVWKAVVQEIVRRPEHEMFDAAWEWALSHDESSVLVRAVDTLGSEHADRVAELLLERKRRTTGEFFPEVWEALFALPVDESIKEGWVARMAEIAPAVLDSLGEATNWVPESHLEKFFSLLQPDYMLITIFSTLLRPRTDSPAEGLSEEITANLLTLVSALLKHTPPILSSTYDYLQRSFKAMKIEDKELINSIAEFRSKTLEVVRGRPKKFYPALRSWIGTS